ncbi:MAG: hypothetical protein ACJ8NR_08070 [Sulfurifustis sp.]
MKFFKPIYSAPQRRGLPKPNFSLWPDHSVRLARDTEISRAEAALFAASASRSDEAARGATTVQVPCRWER